MKKRIYKLRIISEMTGIGEESIIHYEEEGLISPRIENEERFYSQDDLERIRMIRRLTDDLGVNLAGVDIILNMREQILSMQREFEQIMADMKYEMMKGLKEYESRIRRHLIESKTGKVIKIEPED